MDKLVSGVSKFQNQDFHENEDLFRRLAEGQAPEALLITCADSRIDPNLVTQTRPGDLFICRNAGNIVPPHTTVNTGGMTASIEYAVAVLGVEHVIVCGHTDCGAMKGAMYPESVRHLTHVANWLSHSAAALARVRARHESPGDEHLEEMTRENILLQLKHLETHPCIAAALATGDMELHGWLYDIANGTVSCYDAKRGDFVPIEDRYAEILHGQKGRLEAGR